MIHAHADRTAQQPMPASVRATPTVNAWRDGARLAGTPGVDAVLDEIDEVGELVSTRRSEEIQPRASDTPRFADRLRSHLN
jgi:hypothetical protein